MFGKKRAVEYRIVEIEKPRQLPEADPETRAAIVSLAAHPGFLYLATKLHLQRGVLEAQLKGSRHQDIRAVEFLQSGIFWASWLEEQIRRETQLAAPRKEQIPAPAEEDVFRQIHASLESVGTEEEG